MNTRTFFLDNTFENEDWPKRTQDITDYPLFPPKVRVGFVAGALVASCELHGEFACNSKACAPPPVGTGGSLPSGGSDRSGKTSGKTEFGRKIVAMIAEDRNLTMFGRSKSDPSELKAAQMTKYRKELRAAIRGQIQPDGTPSPWNWSELDRVVNISGTGNPAIAIKILNMITPDMLKPNYRAEPFSAEEQLHLGIRRVLKEGFDNESVMVPVDGALYQVRFGLRDTATAKPINVTKTTVKSVIGVGTAVREEITKRIKERISPLMGSRGKQKEKQRAAKELDTIMEKLKEKFPTVSLNTDNAIVVQKEGKTKVVIPSSAMLFGGFHRDDVEMFLTDQFNERNILSFSVDVHVQKFLDKVQSEIVLDTLKEVRDFGGALNMVAISDSDGYRNMIRQELTDGVKGIPTAWVEISNDHGLLSVQYTAKRAQYSHSNQMIDLNGQVDVARHEFAHRAEYTVPGILALEKQFYAMRTDKDKKFVKLKELRPNSSYEDDEYAKPDDFWNPYVGKWYSGTAYEIMSMGTQYVFEHLVDRAMIDRGIRSSTGRKTMDNEYIDFVLGTMLTVQWEG